MLTSQDIADVLRHARQAAGLTIAEAARRSGIEDSVIKNWESQHGVRTTARVLTLLEVYGKRLVLKPIPQSELAVAPRPVAEYLPVD